ncbi:hypothetical protein HY256_07480, partial [Candidatus Sumerlaeota bacterium]|nr:hypothetical protein [Candidatus Sumerlaeota bacterium]
NRFQLTSHLDIFAGYAVRIRNEDWGRFYRFMFKISDEADLALVRGHMLWQACDWLAYSLGAIEVVVGLYLKGLLGVIVVAAAVSGRENEHEIPLVYCDEGEARDKKESDD